MDAWIAHRIAGVQSHQTADQREALETAFQRSAQPEAETPTR